MKADSLNDSEPGRYLENLSEDTFEAIYREYWQSLYNFALLKARDRDVAEEIIQDLFVNLWEKRHGLQITNLKSYLFVSVRNRVIDYYKQKLFADLDSATETVSPDYPLFLDEFEATLQDAVNQLSPKTREIFILNRFEGKSAREISAQLDLPERTVEYHITQGLRHMKASLKNTATVIISFIAGMTI